MGFIRMAGYLLRNSLNVLKKRRDGKSADAPLAGKGRRMSLSARLILLLTITVGVVMALAGYFILRQREEILARALRNELHAHAVTLQLTLEDSYRAGRIGDAAGRIGTEIGRSLQLGCRSLRLDHVAAIHASDCTR